MESDSHFMNIGNTFILLGMVFLVMGLITNITPRWPHLPGDLAIQRENFTFYFPIATSILISILLTLIFNFFR